MVIVSAFGYYVLKDQYYMPTFLGGSGDYLLCYKEAPYPKHAPFLKEYYLIVTGYHLSQIMIHVTGTQKNDFIEMLLHDSATMCLMISSYIFNSWECGAIISFLHNISDIFGHLSRVFSQTRYEKLTLMTFLSHVVTWVLSRNIVLPILIYELWLI